MTLAAHIHGETKKIISGIQHSGLNISVFTSESEDKTTDIFKGEDTMLVSSEIKKEESEKYLDGVKYKIGENEKIYLKDSGIVTFIGKKEGYKNTIIVQQSNGFYAWYGNVKESVKIYDYVEKGSILGESSSDTIYLYYQKDGKFIDYKKYIG